MKTNKELISVAGKIYGDEKYYLLSTFDAMTLSDGRILCVDKVSIKKDFCFGEHGYDFDEVCKTERNSRCFEYFESENTYELKKEIEKFNEKDVYFYKKYWVDGKEKIAEYMLCDEEDLLRRKMDGLEDIRKANDDEKAQLVEILKNRLENMKKRLNVWWKKNGADGLHTWTYWADA